MQLLISPLLQRCYPQQLVEKLVLTSVLYFFPPKTYAHVCLAYRNACISCKPMQAVSYL